MYNFKNFYFIIFILSVSACTKEFNVPNNDISTNSIIKNNSIRPLDITSLILNINIVNDELGNIYWSDIYGGIYKMDAVSSAITSAKACIPIAINPFTVYKGMLTSNGYTNNSSIPNSVQASNVDPLNCGNIINYNYNVGTSIKAISTDYNGGIYLIGSDARVRFKPANSNVFSENVNLLIGNRLPQGRDIACDQAGNVCLITSDGNVHFYGTKIPMIADKVMGRNMNAVSLAVDPLNGKKYIINGTNNKPMGYDDATKVWYSFPGTPNINFWDICVFNKSVFVMATDNVYSTMDISIINKFWHIYSR